MATVLWDLPMDESELEPAPPNLAGTLESSATEAGIHTVIAQRDDGQVIVDYLVYGGQLMAAGVRARDVLLAIDGKSVSGLTLESVKILIRGQAGQDVTLDLLRESAEGGKDLQFQVKVTRTRSLAEDAWLAIFREFLAFVGSADEEAKFVKIADHADPGFAQASALRDEVYGKVLDLKQRGIPKIPEGYRSGEEWDALFQKYLNVMREKDRYENKLELVVNEYEETIRSLQQQVARSEEEKAQVAQDLQSSRRVECAPVIISFARREDFKNGNKEGLVREISSAVSCSPSLVRVHHFDTDSLDLHVNFLADGSEQTPLKAAQKFMEKLKAADASALPSFPSTLQAATKVPQEEVASLSDRVAALQEQREELLKSLERHKEETAVLNHLYQTSLSENERRTKFYEGELSRLREELDAATFSRIRQVDEVQKQKTDAEQLLLKQLAEVEGQLRREKEWNRQLYSENEFMSHGIAVLYDAVKKLDVQLRMANDKLLVDRKDFNELGRRRILEISELETLLVEANRTIELQNQEMIKTRLLEEQLGAMQDELKRESAKTIQVQEICKQQYDKRVQQREEQFLREKKSLEDRMSIYERENAKLHQEAQESLRSVISLKKQAGYQEEYIRSIAIQQNHQEEKNRCIELERLCLCPLADSSPSSGCSSSNSAHWYRCQPLMSCPLTLAVQRDMLKRSGKLEMNNFAQQDLQNPTQVMGEEGERQGNACSKRGMEERKGGKVDMGQSGEGRGRRAGRGEDLRIYLRPFASSRRWRGTTNGSSSSRIS
eukprot:766454-Hanusia_phi.AAC.14